MSVLDGNRRTTLQERAAAEAEAKARRERELEDLKWLMAHAEGRRIIVRILEQTHVYRQSFDTNGAKMSFNEGERNVGLWVTSELMAAAPDKFVQLFRDLQGR